jgi:hypothetical protein
VLQSAAAAKQVLEGHAMYEGGANVLRLSYSVHRDLNVKNSGDKSRDFSMPVGVPSLGYNQYISQQSSGYHTHGGGSAPHHGQHGETCVTGAHWLLPT